MATVFTFPGKMGDCLLQWPVAYQWAKQQNQKIELWLDAGTLKPLERLLAAQAVVERVEFKPGIQSYHLGGQPWDFGLKTEDFIGNTVYHLGLRGFPQRQITLQTLLDSGLSVDKEKLANEPSLHVPALEQDCGRYCVIHGTFQSHNSGCPRLWSFLDWIAKDLEASYDRIIFTGTADERARAREIYDGEHYTDYDDGGDFLELARLVAGAALVVGSGSSGVALAGALKVPTIRVHDPIGDAPKVVWSNLGKHQWNEPEADLRKLWPDIRSALTPVPMEVPT